jgi:hypothetical protein
MKSLRFATLALAAAGALGCDASVEVHGRVYRWVDSPVSARGQVLIDAPESRLPSKVEPLAGAKLAFYFSEDGARRLDPKDRAWGDRVTSELDGGFTAGNACAPGSYEMAVTVQHDGCLPLVQRFPYEDEHPEHEMAILLVCPGIQESDRSRSPSS